MKTDDDDRVRVEKSWRDWLLTGRLGRVMGVGWLVWDKLEGLMGGKDWPRG